MWIGILGQAVIFGARTLMKDGNALSSSECGSMFGVLVLLRRSLRPGMMAHGFHDFFTGIAGTCTSGCSKQNA